AGVLSAKEARAKEAPPDSAEPVAKGRRRRRRRRGHGAGPLSATEAAARPDDSTGPVPALATGRRAAGPPDGTRGEDQDEPPVFSEGPEAEEAQPSGQAAAAALARRGLPPLSELPGVEGAAQGAHRRRRRRWWRRSFSRG